MNIVVCIKQTFDTEAKIVLDSQGKIDATNVNLIINPYDEYAIEEGILLKEKFGGEVVVVTLGGSRAQEALRVALAMGADRAVLVSDPGLAAADEWSTAEVLAKALASLSYDLILAGRVAIDDGAGQVAIRLAEKLNIPSISTVSKLEIDGSQVTAVREIDGGTETIAASLPVVIAAQKGINGVEPRYPSLPGIMKAKKKELKSFTLADLEIEASGVKAKMKVETYTLPPVRQSGRLIPGDAEAAASELARILAVEEKVL